MGVRVYRGDGKDPVKIATEGVRDAIDNLRDVVIIDTAGRLHVDEEMMDEAVAIRDAVEPDQILMVVDAMTGQDVVNVAAAFAEQVDFDGVIMSKMDGDARGGGALSILEVTGQQMCIRDRPSIVPRRVALTSPPVSRPTRPSTGTRLPSSTSSPPSSCV